MKQWQCSVCGYIHEGEEPPEECPVCGADRSQFVLLEDGAPAAEPPSGSSLEATSTKDKQTQWRCTVCGYIHTGSSPPDTCPVCGADRSAFVLVNDAVGQSADDSGPASAQTDTNHSPTGETDRIQKLIPKRFKALSQKITALHGHPVAVHIPNGVLPVSVLFAFFAMLFNSQALAIAAKVNLIMVAISMPVVIVTGIIDWINVFNGRMTQVFKIKMVCAGVVTLLTLLIAVWWVAIPDLYTRGVFDNLFFFLLHVADLVAAAIAGWYGGKLVFQAK